MNFVNVQRWLPRSLWLRVVHLSSQPLGRWVKRMTKTLGVRPHPSRANPRQISSQRASVNPAGTLKILTPFVQVLVEIFSGWLGRLSVIREISLDLRGCSWQGRDSSGRNGASRILERENMSEKGC